MAPEFWAGARGFNGVSSYIGTGQSFLNNLTEFTLSCWASANYDLHRRGFVGQNDSIEFGSIGNITGGEPSIHIWSPNGSGVYGPDIPNYELHHFAASGDDTAKLTYYDGVEVASSPAPQANFGSSSSRVNIGGGGVFDAGGNWLLGMLDEVRISFLARSPNWLWATCYNMASNDQFICSIPRIWINNSGGASNVSGNSS